MKNMLIPKDQIQQFYTNTLSDDYREIYIQLLDEVIDNDKCILYYNKDNVYQLSIVYLCDDININNKSNYNVCGFYYILHKTGLIEKCLALKNKNNEIIASNSRISSEYVSTLDNLISHSYAALNSSICWDCGKKKDLYLADFGLMYMCQDCHKRYNMYCFGNKIRFDVKHKFASIL